MKTKTNTTPRSFAPLVSHMNMMLKAAQSAEVVLLLNTAAKIQTDLYAVAGAPGAEGDLGKHGVYNNAKAVYGALSEELKAVKRRAKRIARGSISRLKPDLGFVWTQAWQAAGFTSGSLANPKDPLPTLFELRAFFRANPERENAAYNMTAEVMDQTATELQTARTNTESAKHRRVLAKQESDAALLALRLRAIGVRKELEQLLPADDSRWYEFDLRRLVDGKVPGAVSGLTLRAGGAGEVIAMWKRSRLAQNYRVKTLVEGAEGDPVEVTLTPALEAVIRDVPSGKKLTVYVSATNGSGETAPAKQEINLN